MFFSNVWRRLAAITTAALLAAVALAAPVGVLAQTNQPDLAIISELTGLPASLAPLGPEWVFDEELQVYLSEPAADPALRVADPAAGNLARAMLNSEGLLLIPDSTNKRVMSFDPQTGDLIDAGFLLLDDVATGTAIHAILGASNNILVSDQTRNVVHNYDISGDYLGVFAPAGGANTAIMQNIRGIALRPNGNLLVSVGGGANANAIAEFDAAGNYLGNFVPNGSGGLNSPFDVYQRVGTDWLVSSINSYQVLSYELATGAFLGEFAPIHSFPQQILELPSGNVLVGDFSGNLVGVVEFTSTGEQVGVYRPASLSGFRGVYELPNGNILTSTSGGVFEITRGGVLVNTKFTGQARFIEYVVIGSVSIGEQSDDEVAPAVPAAPAITAVAPNPFNPRTTVHFDLPRAGNVTVAIHDLRGRLVQTLVQSALDAGSHRISWGGVDTHGEAMPSGVYLARLTTDEGLVRTAKMTLAR